MDEITLGTSVAEQLQDLVISSQDVNAFLAELCELSASSFSRSLGQEVSCAVTLSRHHRTTTAAWSDPEARLFDEIQHNYGEGPCLHAMSTGTTVLVPDTRTDPRWPEYGRAIASLGRLSVLGVPLTLDTGAAAALNVFAPAADVFDAASILKAELFASQAERALRLAVRIGVQQQLAADLRSAMESRTVIDLAAGIIMGQNRCSQAEAMAILTRASSSRNQKLRVVAEKVVESFAPETPSTHFDS
ncbi:GAF and ANTAR domain-containing protein [Arthrobacter sp. B10-11]|uniref:GAF and ANTAR domain-containing protein n=1 Tax=Arthrobacter sp. B10-11 TaxID=3081160 RepID=UPI002955C680|nr:GAF and ANTAR domain-containing protein [Arthrobacter sp. B10-11]MDV8147605.1 GAF and ANTAR domain-containing protein [Arthrobacter sp. B10-11]